MRSVKSSLLLDWIVISIRWLVLLGLTISLSAGSNFSTFLSIALFTAAVWNGLLTILAALNRRLWAHTYLSVVIDVAIATTFFILDGTFEGSIAWVGLLPITSAALYFQIQGALLVTLFTLVSQGIIALSVNSQISVLVSLGLLVPLYLMYSVLLGYISGRMRTNLRIDQHTEGFTHQEATRSGSGRNMAIFNLVSALNSTLNYQRVLDTALDLGYGTLATINGPDDQMVSAVYLFSGGKSQSQVLRVGSARRFTHADMRITLSGTKGLIGRTIEDGMSRQARQVARDPELGQVIALRACKVAYCIPLRTGLDTYGVLLFAHPDENFFTSDRQEILEIIGNQAVVAIQNASLYRDLELEKERMMKIQEEARVKLARELHDGPTQSVAALAMRVNFARRLIERDPKSAADELYKVENIARQTTKEIRHLLFTLRPLILESQGLVAGLESMAEKLRETYNQDVIIDADRDIVSKLELGKQGVIFYLAEEAVNNARKHAQAEHIWVRIKTAGYERISLEIEDDGVGFNVDLLNKDYEKRGSLGMVNLRERTELVNGILQIESAEGHGTKITVIIPLTDDAADRIRRGL